MSIPSRFLTPHNQVSSYFVHSLGLALADMQAVMAGLQRSQFYKSMTTYDNHRVWHDVYHFHSHDLQLYIKVTYRPSGGPPVVSFKEKNA